MEFGWNDEEQAFRAEVRAFLDEHWDAKPLHEFGTDDHKAREYVRAFKMKLAEHKWLTMAWPVEYGGQGASFVRQMIFKEESAIQKAPTSGGAEDILAPALMIHGTDEQKREYLMPISRGEVLWSQGYSEPGAGSDLASLQTRATRDGDEYVINGQKVWNGSHRGDWIHTLVRTDPEAPKHRGISYVMINLRQPGVSIRPIWQIHDTGRFNEVFFEDVRVPVSARIGEENRGWYTAMTALDFERSGIHLIIGVQGGFERFVEHARSAGSDAGSDAGSGASGGRLIDRSAVARAVADTHIELEVARLLSYRITSMQSRGLVPNYEASVAKTFGTELTQRQARRAINALGPAGALREGSRYAVGEGSFCEVYMSSISATIAGGTSEINRGVIATRGLGLPRA
ncbi:MAG: acyl-CoA dehydrogenase family protein [Chloroflexi bacterium]|nr:acyl-CoA dehydrogenase family protein [Chloroflexota bacterium]